MKISDVINMDLTVLYSDGFQKDVERILTINTEENKGTSERVEQLGEWIRSLVKTIQYIGNITEDDELPIEDSYIKYESELGDFFLSIYENSAKSVVYINSVN